MILVTGGTGLVGTHLIYQLLSKGEKVRAIRRSGSKTEKLTKIISYYHTNPQELLSNLEWVYADILDIYSLEKAMEGISYVYHCAAIISFNPAEHSNMIFNNTEGTANVVNTALNKKIKKLCHISSIAAIGRDSTKKIITENNQWVYNKEQSAYSISKYESEREVWRAIAEGLDAVIINPSVIIGPGHWEEGSSKILTTIWKGLKFYTKGITGYVDVRDVAKSMILLMNNNICNERYLISSENLSYKELFQTISKEMNIDPPKYYANKFLSAIVWRVFKLSSFFTGKSSLITKETARTANKQYHFSNSKIKKALGIEFIPIKKSIRDTTIWFLKEQKNSY